MCDSVAYGAILETRHSYLCAIMRTVAKNIKVYTQDTRVLVAEFRHIEGEMEYFHMRTFRNVYIKVELFDEVEGPTEFLVYNNGHVGSITGEGIDCPKVLYTSKTYPNVKIGIPTICLVMVYTQSERPTCADDALIEHYENTRDTREDCAQIAYVCDKLEIDDRVIGWSHDCCS